MEPDPESLVQLVYISAATVPFDGEALDALLAVSRANNEKLDVSGLLMYHKGSFLQVLEGRRADVTALYGKIFRDERHGKVTKLLEREIPAREFGDWRMGFPRPATWSRTDPPAYARFMEQGLAATSVAPTADRVRRVLEQFRDNRWRQTVSDG